MEIQKITTPTAILIAGLLIAIAVFAGTSSKSPNPKSEKSVAAKIGLNEKKLQACAEANTYNDKIQADIETGDRALAIVPEDMRGTPYNVIINVKTGKKVELAGAYPHDSFKQVIDALISGNAKGEAIDLEPISAKDHYFGNKDAEIVIVEYGDLECPYCAAVQPTIDQILKEYNGKVAWVYRHFPLSIHASDQNYS
jgi:protein-disulfide isomerase